MKRPIQILMVLVFLTEISFSQSSKREIFDVSGYVKDLQIIQFDFESDPLFDNLIHNRLNLRLYPTSKLSFGLDIRNRIYFGDSPRNSSFSDMLDVDPGSVDMSWLIFDTDNSLYLLQFDRAWIDWTENKWSLRIGRQRINWGINLYWNSNDLFNTFNIAEFDYEELPGADALRLQTHFKKMNSVEFALQPADDKDEWKAGILYKFNKRGYDFQTLLGWWNTDIAIGGGWAGNIKNAGFKGELTYFIPREGLSSGSDAISLSLSTDYFFRNSLYLTGGFLLNSSGTTRSLESSEGLFLSTTSAKSLMPSKFNFLINASYPVTPLISISALALYSPGPELIYFIPNFNYSISENWELGIFVQTFWAQVDEIENFGNSWVLRFKMSY